MDSCPFGNLKTCAPQGYRIKSRTTARPTQSQKARSHHNARICPPDLYFTCSLQGGLRDCDAGSRPNPHYETYGPLPKRTTRSSRHGGPVLAVHGVFIEILQCMDTVKRVHQFGSRSGFLFISNLAIRARSRRSRINNRLSKTRPICPTPSRWTSPQGGPKRPVPAENMGSLFVLLEPFPE